MSSTFGRKAVCAICAATLCLGAGGMLAGCAGNAQQDSSSASQQQAAQSETRVFTDSLGRQVEVPATIERIAPSGSISQQVLMTVAGDKLVGLSGGPSANQEKYFGDKYSGMDEFGTIVGGKGDFNKEAVAAAVAQIVIDVGQPKDGLAEDLDTLQQQLGIPCIHVSTTLDTFGDAYRMLGDLLGVQDKAEELATYCDETYKEMSEFAASIPEDERVTVAYLQGDTGLQAMPKGSYHSVITDMVADNVVVLENGAQVSGAGSETSLEQIALWDPELIIFGPASVYDTVADDPAWQSLSAIRTGNYYQIPNTPYDWMNRPPSVNQLLGLQWLPRICYPDKFDDDMYEVVSGYYKLFYDYDMSQADFDELMAKAMPQK